MGLLDDAIREHLDLKRKRGADPGEIERLEREALGPVRREPMPRAGIPHLEVAPEHLEPAFEHHEELTHADLEHQAPAHFDHEQHAPIEEDQPQKRGFLRRTRPASLAEPGPVDFEQHLAAHDAPPAPQAEQPPAAQPEPPALTFESAPPKRPRFSPDPAQGDAPAHPSEPPAAGPPAEQAAPAVGAPAPAAPAATTPPPAPPTPPAHDRSEETHEWDVEHAFAAEDAGHQQVGPPTSEEDVLEETPEFLQDTPDHDRLWFEQRPPRDFDFDG